MVAMANLRVYAIKLKACLGTRKIPIHHKEGPKRHSLTKALAYISQKLLSSQILISSQNELESVQPPKPEILAGNLLNREGSTSATSQGRRSPSTQHGYHKDVIAIGDAKDSKDLWLQAYKKLESRERDLVAAYKHHLAPTIANSTDSSLSPELIETIIQLNLEDKKANQWVVSLGKKPVKVREQGEKVIKFILWSKDIISQALSAQPYAALAWSGVSILLPVSYALI